MYRQLFGFKKNPFRQTTDSERLFLGRHHEEALAHLTYAVMEGEGFSSITGESGVGKTTVCRSFVERLTQEVVAAYITAKTGLSPLQLLKTINAEFKVRSDIGTIKNLTDALNAFLIQKKREGKKVALFIDDAQLLSDEALEQVRLLSNLETTRDKLLQIVLIGRPALSEMLDAPSLRQIGQRVSVNYLISPLDYEETVAYVQHRISISSTGPPIRFDQAAIRPIYKFTKGLPRQINIACDRILTAAYKYRERNITGKTAKDVLRQWHKGPDLALYYVFRQKLPAIAIAGVLILMVIVSSVYFFSGKKTDAPTLATGPKTDRPTSRKPSQPPPAPTQAEPVATTASPEKIRPAEPTLKKSKAAADQTAPRTPSQPPPAPIQAEPVATTASPEKIRPAEPALKNSEAAASESRFLAVLDSLRLQHNLDHVEAATAVGSKPSVELTYSVQVGAFLLAMNAQQRVNQLKSKGYTPRIIAVTDPQERIWFTVRIGDFPSLEQAQKQADEFTAREKKASVVRPYNLY
jgi:type II secretory pathway predicted ATPase ExeA/cell division protein FtsN